MWLLIYYNYAGEAFIKGLFSSKEKALERIGRSGFPQVNYSLQGYDATEEVQGMTPGG